MLPWLTKVWWARATATPSTFATGYYWFNLAEGTAWCLLAVLVVRRYARCRNSPLEIVYALAFFTFGLTDFREAYCLQTWLILAKGANLLALLLLRRRLLRRFYPASKTF